MVAVTVLGGATFVEVDAKRRAEHVGLDVMGGEAVAREEHVDDAFADEAGQVGPGTGVDDGGPAHHEHPPARVASIADALGHLRHEQVLGLLGRHLRRHELEGARAAWPFQRLHAHALVAYNDPIAHPYPVHGHRAHDRIVEHYQRTVHLGVFDVEPAAVEPHLGRQVRGGVETGREHAVDHARHQLGVGAAHPVGAVHQQFGQQ